jgi:hypothetical protein
MILHVFFCQLKERRDEIPSLFRKVPMIFKVTGGDHLTIQEEVNYPRESVPVLQL